MRLKENLSKQEKISLIANKEKELFDEYCKTRTRLMNEYFQEKGWNFKDIDVFSAYKTYSKEDYAKIKEARDFAQKHDDCLSIQQQILDLHTDFYLAKAHNNYANLIQKRDGDVWAVANVIYMGMADALPNYNPNIKIKFISFAEKYIKNAIKVDVAKDMNVTPYYAVNINKYNFAKEKLIQIYGTDDRPVSDYESETGLSSLKLLMTQENKEVAASVSITDEEVFDYMDLTSDLGNPEDKAVEDVQFECLYNAINNIPGLQREIIIKYFGFNDEPMSIKEISKEMDLKESDVKKNIDAALLTLRENKILRKTFDIEDKIRKRKPKKEDFNYRVEL